MGAMSGAETVEARLSATQKAWEDAQASLRSLLDQKRFLRDQISGLMTRVGDIAVHLARFAKLQEVYESDVARLTALEEAGNLLMIGSDRECPLCGALPEHQRKEHGIEDIEQQQAAARVEIGKIRKQEADLNETITDLNAEAATLELRLREAQARLEAAEGEIRRASPGLSENQRVLSEVLRHRDLVRQQVQLVEQRENLEKRLAEYKQMKQSKKAFACAQGAGDGSARVLQGDE